VPDTGRRWQCDQRKEGTSTRPTATHSQSTRAFTRDLTTVVLPHPRQQAGTSAAPVAFPANPDTHHRTTTKQSFTSKTYAEGPPVLRKSAQQTPSITGRISQVGRQGKKRITCSDIAAKTNGNNVTTHTQGEEHPLHQKLSLGSFLRPL